MFDPAPSYDDAELIKRIVAIERRLDIIETFPIRLWTGSPISCGTTTSTFPPLGWSVTVTQQEG